MKKLQQKQYFTPGESDKMVIRILWFSLGFFIAFLLFLSGLLIVNTD